MKTRVIPGRPIRTLPWWIVLAGLLLVILSTTAVLVWLLYVAGADPTRRIEAIKAGFTVGLGAGGTLALLLAVRRQWLQERTQVHAEHVAADNAQRAERMATDARYDAAERRLTEPFIKSVEQLGSAKAPVRLGGLYALERLAQENPEHRQTAADMICAYLRMPYEPPALTTTSPTAVPTDDSDSEKSGSARRMERMESEWQLREELQVRQIAQRILAAHLQIASNTDRSAESMPDSAQYPKYWSVAVDLRRAHLVDAEFSQCRFDSTAIFGDVTFTGGAGFNGAVFNRSAVFNKACFPEGAEFGGAAFNGGAVFDGAAFADDAKFAKATFTEDAAFGGATFMGNAVFRGATFTSDAVFEKATFTSDAVFENATFNGGDEHRMGIHRYAYFTRATFSGAAAFKKATFNGYAWFDQATFTRDADFEAATFVSDAMFEEATFNKGAWFDKANFGRDARFDEAKLHGQVWWRGSSLRGEASFKNARVQASSELQQEAWLRGWKLGPELDCWHTLIKERGALGA